MDASTANEVISCLPKGRTLFYYYKGRYAPLILSWMTKEPARIRDLRKTRFARLLNVPVMKGLIAEKGDGTLSAADLEALWPDDPECYRLTLGTWGEERPPRRARHYHQTSRPGINLVLQLNFSMRHDRQYRRLIDPDNRQPFQYSAHPVRRGGMQTLAWARLDLDLASGEALIEEIQTDWVRLAGRTRKYFDALVSDQEARRELGRVIMGGVEIGEKEMRSYFDNALSHHVKLWDEAMLSAALWFLVEEIGLKTIFYHSFDCGSRLKHIGSDPPRSLYTTLPAKFCLSEQPAAPGFLAQNPTSAFRTLEKAQKLRFWVLEL